MTLPKQNIQLLLHDTEVLKGIALLLLLCHHCLYTGEDYDDIVIWGYPIFKSLGIFSKLCVASFVFLSGYGLTAGAIKNDGIGSVMQFYRKRYVKLMINYWLIYLIFVPLGFFFFNRTFSSVYGDNYALRGLADFLGVHQLIIGNASGYNPTWWFYSLILVLYFLYPLIWKCRYYWFLLIPSSIMLPFLFSKIPLLSSSLSGDYMLSFVCGFSLAYVNISIPKRTITKWIVFMVLLMSCGFRFVVSNSILWDSSIIIIGVCFYKLFSIPRFVSTPLAFLGKHSFNIFLFHTFIFAFYFHDCIYWSRNPILICLTLLAVCIIISLLIEWFKNLLRINILQERLIKYNDTV